MILIDKDGYPTEESLLDIEERHISSDQEVINVLEEIKNAWKYKDWAKKISDELYQFSTGGWSGNELMIFAFENNVMCQVYCKIFSIEGGHYLIATGETKGKLEKKLNRLFWFYVDNKLNEKEDDYTYKELFKEYD